MSEAVLKAMTQENGLEMGYSPSVVAVYGTLRYGGSANSLMRGAKLMGSDTVKGSLYNMGAFPAFKRDSKQIVVVDLYKLPEDGGELLKRMDRYEGFVDGHPDESLYTRQQIITDNGIVCWVYVYCYDVHEELLIDSGDWLSAKPLGE